MPLPCGAFPQNSPGDASSTALPAQRMGGGERGEVAQDVGGGRRKKQQSLQRQDTFVLQDTAEVEDEGDPNPKEGKVGPVGMVIDKPVEDEGPDISQYVHNW